MSLKTKFLCLLSPLFLLIFAVHSAFVYQATYRNVLAGLEEEAHSIRNVLMSTRRVYHHQFINSGIEVNDDTIGFLPAHAMGLISKDFGNWEQGHLTFNNVSDRARNPDNAADASELEAMDYFRANPDVENRFVFVEGSRPLYHYTEPIWIEPYCLTCHGSKEDAPASISARYPGSYDYKLGDLRGVVSIKLPLEEAESRAQIVLAQALTINLIGYIAVFGALYFLLVRFAIRPLKSLEQGSEALAAGDYAWRSGVTGSDEIAAVAKGFDAMAGQIAQRVLDLRESEGMYRSVAETAGDAIITTDTSGAITSWNAAAERIFGYGADEALGQDAEMLVADSVKASHTEKFTLATSVPTGTFINGRTVESIGLRKGGIQFPAEVSLSMWESNEQRSFTAIIRDITESKRLQEELFQSQKMDAIGKLTGGIAHDFNNLLHVINGFGEAALMTSQEGGSVEDDVTEMIHATHKASALVNQLLAFSRRQVLELKNIDLAEVVNAMAKMIKRIIGEHITVTIDSAPNLKPVVADAGLLEQIVMNLCINARDAMPEGGELTISANNINLDEAFLGPDSSSAPGDYVVLRVADTGKGMDFKTSEQIFEPFFTTKTQGKGTGLGLSTVYGIVKQHNGIIHLDSQVGRGTTFTIYFPAVDGSVAEQALSRPKEVRGGTETILVADDDPGVLELARLMLEGAGYTVITARDGEEALRVFDEHHDEIDAALLDVVMPKASGKAVYDRIQELRPGLRVLFASGYDNGTLHTEFILAQDIQLIQKPYARASLLVRMRELLDSR